MLKLAGAGVIFFSALLLGYLPILRLKHRMEQLAQWIRILELMYAELHTNMVSVPQLVERFAQENISVFMDVNGQIQAYGAAIFETAWTDALENSSILFIPSEREAIGKLGCILGKYLLEDELPALEQVISLLRKNLEACAEQLRAKGKLSVSLSGALGLMLVVVLI